jgi:hypothetical protein
MAAGKTNVNALKRLVNIILKYEPINYIGPFGMQQFYFRNSAHSLDEQLFVLSQQLNLSEMPVLKTQEQKQKYLSDLEIDFVYSLNHDNKDILNEQLSAMSQQLNLSEMPVLKTQEQKQEYLSDLKTKFFHSFN